MPVVTFDYPSWLARYPEFGGRVDADRAQACFDEVCATLLDNSENSRFTDVPRRTALLWMLTAHVAELSAPGPNGEQPPARMVGQMTGVSEGSVSISMSAMQADGPGAWFMLTRYGAQYWTATMRERMGRYYRGPVGLPRPANVFTGRPI